MSAEQKKERRSTILKAAVCLFAVHPFPEISMDAIAQTAGVAKGTLYLYFSTFLHVAGQQASLYQRLMMMRSADVARIGINRMLQRKPGVVTGFMNNLTIFLNRFIPRRLSTWFAEKFMTVGQSNKNM